MCYDICLEASCAADIFSVTVATMPWVLNDAKRRMNILAKIMPHCTYVDKERTIGLNFSQYSSVVSSGA